MPTEPLNPNKTRDSDDRPSPSVCRESKDSTIGDLSDSQLLERIIAEQRELGGDNDAPTVEDYLARFPRLKSNQESCLDLVYNEFLTRRENTNAGNQLPKPEEYLQRFPEFSSALHDQFQLYMGLDSGLVQDEGGSHVLKNEPSDEGLVGRTIGQRYEIKKRLGHGGFAFVYQARDLRLRRMVAVKVSRFVFEPNSKQAKRFAREAESIARLSHPGILQVYEVGEFEGRPFFVGQLAEGGSLERQLRNGALDETTLVNWMIEICEAVEYSHQFGVVHRDLKPANILFHNRSPKIVDFGLASMTESEINLTLQGDLVGTPAYMSPEQALGATEVIAASDQYSLGVILFQCLTGKLPFSGTTTQLIQQVIDSDPPVPKSINSNISLDLQTICLKALAKSPEQRYSSVREMAADLRRFQAHEPIMARPIGWAGKLRRWCIRQPALAATLFAATLLLVAISWFSVDRITAERDRFRGERDRANAQLFASLVSNAENDIAAKPTDWWKDAFDTLVEAKSLADAPHEVSRVRELMTKLLVNNALRLTTQPQSYRSTVHVSAIAAASKERFVAIGDSLGHIQLRSFDLQTELLSLPNPSSQEVAVGEICLLQDSEQLVARIGDQVWVWRLYIDDGPHAPIVRCDPPKLLIAQATCIDSSPTQAILAVGVLGKLLIYENFKSDSVNGTAPPSTQTCAIGNTNVMSISFSEQKPHVVVGLADSTIQVWSLASARKLHSKRILREPVRHVAYWRGNIVWSDSTSFAAYFWNPDLDREIKTNHFPSAVNGTTTLNGQPICTTTEGQIYVINTLETLDGNPQVSLSVGGFGELTCTSKPNNNKSIFAAYRNGKIQRWELERSDVVQSHYSYQPLCITPGGFLFNGREGVDLTGEDQTISTSSPPIEHLQVDDESNDLFCIEGRDLICLRHASGQIERLNNFATAPIVDLAIDAKTRRLHVLDNAGTVTAIKLNDLAMHGRRQLITNKATQIAAQGDEVVLVDDGQVCLLSGNNDSLVEVTALRGIRSLINDCEIVAAQNDLEVNVYRFGEWENALATFKSPAPIRFCALTRDTNTSQPVLAVIDSSDLLTVWDIETRTVTHQIELPFDAESCQFDPLGKFFIVSIANSAGRDESIVYELDTGQQIALLEATSAARAVRFSGDGKAIWVIGRGVMQINRAKLEAAFRETQQKESAKQANRIDCDFDYIVPGQACFHIWDIDVSLNGRWHVSVGQDQGVRIRDVGDHRVRHFLTEHDDVVWSCNFSKDSRHLATGSVRERRGEIIVWDTNSWKPLRRLYVGSKLISGLQFHPSQPLLAATCFDGTAWLLNFKTGETVKQLLPKGPRSMDAEFTADGKYLAIAQTSLGTSVFEITSKFSQFDAKLHRQVSDSNERVWTVAFPADGQSLITATQSGLIRFYAMPDLDKVVTIETSSNGIRQLSIRGDDQSLAFSSWPSAAGQIINLKQLRIKLAGLGLDW